MQLSNRQCLVASILGFYLIPLLFFSSYSLRLMSHHKSWMLLSIGLLLLSLGTLSLIFLLFHWEQSLKAHAQLAADERERETKVTPLDPLLSLSLPKEEEMPAASSLLPAEEARLHEEIERLEGTLNAAQEESRRLKEELERSSQDFADYKLFSEEQLKQKHQQLKVALEELDAQKGEMEKRQELISQLDSKVHDLSYEIKTILQVQKVEAETPPAGKTPKSATIALFEDAGREEALSSHDEGPAILDHTGFITTPQEASKLMRRCLDTAQKLTGTYYYGSEASRYREFPTSYFAIDQRRLYESLQGETGAMIVVYSHKEHKPIFVNNRVRSLLGWSEERFLSHFSSIMQEGLGEWRKAIQSLSSAGLNEVQLRLLGKTKTGEELVLHTHLANIPSGLFRHCAIGIFYV